MTVSEIYQQLDQLAPKALSDEYCRTFGAYDNSGVLVDCGGEIQGVLFTLDLTKTAIERAKNVGANLIVTHHPVIYGKIGDVKVGSALGGRLIACIRAGISVISMHLNLDCAVGGIDDCLADGVYLAAANANEANTQGAGTPRTNEKRYHVLSAGGYGSVYAVPSVRAESLRENMEKHFRAPVRLIGDAAKTVGKVASFCGAGVDDGSVAFAIGCGVDAIVSSDWKHHLVLACHEAGVAVFQLSHYASEEYGFERYYEKMCKSIPIPCELHREDGLL